MAEDTPLEIIVSFNGGSTKVTTPKTLSQFLEQEKIANRPGMAIAINNAVVPRSKWEETELKMNDSILAITPTQGG